MSFKIGKNLETQEPFYLKIKDVVASRTYIASETRFGKSHLGRKIVEECFGHVGIIIIDPEGEYASLREKYPFLIIGRDVPIEVETETLKAATAEFMAQQILETKVSVIIDLSLVEDVEAAKEYVDAFLRKFFHLQTTAKQPYLVLWEEGEDFAPESGAPGTRTCLGIATTYARRGGKRGIGIIFIGHRPAWISKGILSQCPNKAIGRIESTDMKALEEYARIPKTIVEKLVPKTNDAGEVAYPGPARGEFCFTGDWVEKVTFVKVGPVKTTHLGASPEIIPFAPKELQSVIDTLQKNLQQAIQTIKPAVISKTEIESKIRSELETKYKDKINAIKKTAEEKAERKLQIEIERLKTLNEKLSRSQVLQPTAPITDVFDHPIVNTRMNELSDKARDLLIKIEREPGQTREQLAAFLTTSTNSIANMIKGINRVFHATAIITEGRRPIKYRSLLKRLFLTDVAKREIEELQFLQNQVTSLQEQLTQLRGEKEKRISLEKELRGLSRLQADNEKLRNLTSTQKEQIDTLQGKVSILETKLGSFKKLREAIQEISGTSAIIDEEKITTMVQNKIKELVLEDKSTSLLSEEQIAELIKKHVTEIMGALPQEVSSGETINLEHKRVAINVQYVGEETVTITTDTAAGKVLYCAKVDLAKDADGQPKEVFTWTEVMNAFLENGWRISKGTLSNTLSDLTKQGRLIRLKEGYRLPTKVSFNLQTSK